MYEMHRHKTLGVAALASLSQLQLGHSITTRFGDYADDCPLACTANPSQWTKFHGVDRLAGCKDDLLFDFNTLLAQVDSTTIIRACSLASGAKQPLDLPELASISPLSIETGCGAKAQTKTVTVSTAAVSAPQNGTLVSRKDVGAAAANLANYLKQHDSCGSTTLFAKVGNTVLGFYSGADVEKTSTAGFLQQFEPAPNGVSLMQTCKQTSEGADTTIGIIGGTLDHLPTVLHHNVRAWVNGTCAEGSTLSSQPHRLNVLVSTTSANTTSSSTLTIRHRANRRGECQDIRVHLGDSCGSLASRCGISGPDFEKYNSFQNNLCSTLKDKQYVCCSVGTLPDHRPKPEGDGSCKTYKVAKGEGCSALADRFGITQNDLEDFNKQTWGWAGCAHLQYDQLICLSTGRPPFPLPVADTKCGPLVPGSKPDPGQTDFSTLNPCPLNSCCDVWGYCGVTSEFCTPSPADTGAPGTAKPGTNGCISNCGTDLKKSDPPASFMKVAYFEAWNWQRSCLHMNVDSMGGDHTHVHFAFATVSQDWGVVIDDKVKGQFDKFKKLSGVKKILSFGGWAFSTEQGTFQRFRDATKDANRETFASNAAQFLKDNGIDGLDFDWEYPGAPDIPDIPAGTSDEGKNYLKFLGSLRGKLASDKSLSIALPSSFWYLQAYPVSAMSRYVDYFIYMTYDLHGQWDYGNKWTSPGCPTGNCIRSHVNITETQTSLSMITKAGVPSNKVVVGVSSYGRSFRLQDAACTTPQCLFTGSNVHSDAYKGRCTDTSGYISNAELQEIKDGKKYSSVRSWYDADSDSNMMVYGDGGKMDWVAYMDDSTKSKRLDTYKGYNFAGVTDWAVDLAAFQTNDGGDNPDGPPPDHDHNHDPSSLTCNDAKMSYQPRDIPATIFAPYGEGQTTYVVIVNLTPHKFKLEHSHAYEYDIKFDDVYPGHMMQGSFSRGDGNSPVDDHAEIYYNVEGTDKKFVIRLTNNNQGSGTFERVICDLRDMGLGSRELMVPGQAPLVVTGSQRAGFRSSIRLDEKVAGWMQSIKSTIADRRIKDVILPGTHDSAMSTISHKLITAAGSSNTQTQSQNIYNQLCLGARWFDLRVISVHGTSGIEGQYEFYGAHVNDETLAACIGNTGQSLDDIVSDINKFTSENPGEVMFFRVRYMVGIRKVPSLGPISWVGNLYDDFLNRMQGVNNRCLNLDGNFGEKKMGTLMDMNQGKGCVIFLLAPANFDGTAERPAMGLYDQARLVISDDWANTESDKDMIAQETKNWQDPLQFIIQIAQWLLTSQGADVISWDNHYAAVNVNPLIYSHAVNAISPTAWPGVIMVDYIGETSTAGSDFSSLGAELAMLVIGLNQYMLSENCNVNKKYPPLLDLPEGYSASTMMAMELAAVPEVEQWNGFIFANGTVVDHPSPDLGVYNGPHKNDGITKWYV